MSADEKCVIEYFTAANQDVVEAIAPARDMAKEGSVDQLGRYVVHCGRCEADLAISTDFGSPVALTLVEAPQKPDEACHDASRTAKGAWIANLSTNWFEVSLLKGSKTVESPIDSGEIMTREIEIDGEGLEEVLDEAARRIKYATKLRSNGGGEQAALANMERAHAAADLLGKVTNVSKEDWQDIIRQRTETLQEES